MACIALTCAWRNEIGVRTGMTLPAAAGVDCEGVTGAGVDTLLEYLDAPVHGSPAVDTGGGDCGVGEATGAAPR